MFAHDLCHSQIEYLRNSTRREPQGRTIDFNRKDRATRGALAAQALGAAGAPALRERLPQIFNFQYSIVNSGLSGLGFMFAENFLLAVRQKSEVKGIVF